MSLLLNMLSRLVITFLPRSKCLLISWLQSPSAVIWEPKKLKSATVSTVSPPICHEVMGLDTMVFVFWMLSFKPTFSFSSFTLTEKLFSFFSLSAIRVVSSAYLRLMIFLPAILIPAYVSSSPSFLMIYSAYLTYMQSTSWETLDWKKHKLESRLPEEISITSDMQMTPPYGRKWRRTEEPFDESKRGEWKSWLKAQHSGN